MKDIETVTSIIKYIESNLIEKLDLDQIAAAVHYSKFHLHRLFKDTVGITIHDYLKRRQLTEAAKLLVFSSQSVLDIAIISGYESQQAFHAVFKSMYKQSPSQFRNNERFYPLQLRFELEGDYHMLSDEQENWEADFAADKDIEGWVCLAKLVVSGYPFFDEGDCIDALKCSISRREALVIKDQEQSVGILQFSRQTGSIDFLGVHPLYRKKQIPKAMLDKVMNELLESSEISTTTYRSGDKADQGQRRQLMDLGFAESELLVEFGYPTQRFIIPKEECNE